MYSRDFSIAGNVTVAASRSAHRLGDPNGLSSSKLSARRHPIQPGEFLHRHSRTSSNGGERVAPPHLIRSNLNPVAAAIAFGDLFSRNSNFAYSLVFRQCRVSDFELLLHSPRDFDRIALTGRRCAAPQLGVQVLNRFVRNAHQISDNLQISLRGKLNGVVVQLWVGPHVEAVAFLILADDYYRKNARHVIASLLRQESPLVELPEIGIATSGDRAVDSIFARVVSRHR